MVDEQPTSAPAEPTSAQTPESAPSVPTEQPAAGGAPEAPTPQERAKEPTSRSSIDRAFAAIDAAEAKEQTTQLATGERPRDQSGRFLPKEGTGLVPQAPPDAKALAEKPAAVTAIEPPARFSADAKAAWAQTPDPVKDQINRAMQELEGGLIQYQEAFEPLRPFYDLANQHGIEVHKALEQYVGLDTDLISSDPSTKLAALNHVFAHAGIDPREFAANLLGQPADQAHAQLQAENREWQRYAQRLEREVQAHRAAREAQQFTTTQQDVQGFAQTHPRLQDNDFASVVTRVIKTGLADDLPSAYEYAERLKPAADPQGAAPVTAQTGAPLPTAQTGKGNLSITGAPASGSHPGERKPPASAKEAVDNAFATMGLG